MKSYEDWLNDAIASTNVGKTDEEAKQRKVVVTEMDIINGELRTKSFEHTYDLTTNELVSVEEILK